MGANDAAEQLVVAIEECVRLEREVARLSELIARIVRDAKLGLAKGGDVAPGSFSAGQDSQARDTLRVLEGAVDGR